MINVVLFDLDNTLANTDAIAHIRDSGSYGMLTAEALGSVRPYKPVKGLLNKLKNMGVTLGVVTNSGRQYATKVLQHLEILHYFDTVVTYTDVKAEGMKPSAAGIKLAFERLGIPVSPDSLYVGDHTNDIAAAYNAGVTPVLPTWASRAPVNIAPAIELSSAMLIDYVESPLEFQLFAELCSKHKSSKYRKKMLYFIPLDENANVVTLKEQMRTFCLGRYFSKKSLLTSNLHVRHPLSCSISNKDQEGFSPPEYWAEALAHIIDKGAEYVLGEGCDFDIITVIPSKPKKPRRLERVLDQIQKELKKRGKAVKVREDIFFFLSDAESHKNLGRSQRAFEAERAMHLNPLRIGDIEGKNVLVVDDVVTTGSILRRAYSLLNEQGASSAIGLALAKTVSIQEAEKTCPECSRPMRIRRHGKTQVPFWSCSGYHAKTDRCEAIVSIYAKKCPSCSKDLFINKNSYTGQLFWSCPGFRCSPSCRYSETIGALENLN